MKKRRLSWMANHPDKKRAAVSECACMVGAYGPLKASRGMVA